MNAIVINKDNFEKEVLQSDKPVLVDFWASWCGPCRMFSPTVDAIAEEYADEVKVGKLNVDDEGSIAAQYHVASIPTIILFKNGEPVKRSVGALPKDAVVEMFR
ncbi:MAG TPA: thioredoxin [Clostridiales bacterium]|nr:thioredoxin [Clostridiales bacterium]